jgi:hypothetical protein
MYMRFIRYVPALGKHRELRALLESRMQGRQSLGRRNSLLEQTVPPHGLTYLVIDVHEDLNELGSWRQQLRTDPAVEAFQDQLFALLAHPPTFELFEVLVPFPPQP